MKKILIIAIVLTSGPVLTCENQSFLSKKIEETKMFQKEKWQEGKKQNLSNSNKIKSFFAVNQSKVSTQ